MDADERAAGGAAGGAPEGRVEAEATDGEDRRVKESDEREGEDVLDAGGVRGDRLLRTGEAGLVCLEGPSEEAISQREERAYNPAEA